MDGAATAPSCPTARVTVRVCGTVGGRKVRVQRSMVAGVISKDGGSSVAAAPGGDQQQAGGLLGGLFGRK